MADCLLFFPSNSFLFNAYKAFGVMFMIYAPIITTTNVLLIASFIATKQSIENASNLLIVCLSISDCMTGAISMPLLGIQYFWYDSMMRCSIEVFSMTLQSCLSGISICMTVLLAADRYLHMNPDFYGSSSRIAEWFERPGIYIMISICGLFCAGLSCGFYFAAKHGIKATAYFNMYYTIGMLASMTFLLAMYTRGYLRIRRFVSENPIYDNGEASHSSKGAGYLRELFKTVLLLLIAMFVGWVPSIVTNSAFAISYFVNKTFPSSNGFMVFEMVSLLLLHSNAVTNALIIFYRNKKSKEWLLSKVFSCFNKPRNEEEEPNNAVVICNMEPLGP